MCFARKVEETVKRGKCRMDFGTVKLYYTLKKCRAMGISVVLHFFNSPRT